MVELRLRKPSRHFTFEEPKPQTFRDFCRLLLHRSFQLISCLLNIDDDNKRHQKSQIIIFKIVQKKMVLIPADPASEMSQFKVYLQGEIIQ